MGFYLIAETGGCSLGVVYGLLIAVASLAVEHGSKACTLQWLWHVGTLVAVPGL